MPSPFEPFLLENGFVILDGGLATELETQGADLTGELWSAALLADNPSLIRETHLAYYRAGADVATTASYQVSFEGFLRKGYRRERAEELLLLSVKLAVEARDRFWAEYQGRSSSPATASKMIAETSTPPPPPPTTATATAETEAGQAPQQRGRSGDKRHRRRRPLVAASIGCYGAALADGSEYRGGYGETVGQRGLKDWHKERFDILSRADGVDLLMFETVPCLAEVRAVLSLLEDLRPRRSAVISISCRDGQHLRSGERVQDFADLIWRGTKGTGGEGTGETAATPPCVVGVGVNCTAPNHAASVVRTLSETACKGRPSSNPCTKASHSKNTETTAPVPTKSDSPAAVPPGARCGAREGPPGVVIVVYPNSGEQWDAGSRDWVQGTGLRGVEEIGRLARDEWYLEGKGAHVFGGCCRTRPAHIAEIRRALDSCALSFSGE